MEDSVMVSTPDFESGTEGSTPSLPAISSSFGSYPQIYGLGHRYIEDLLKDPVTVEEKIDGSQFSFGKYAGGGDYLNALRCRSKGAEIHMEAPEKMFSKAIATVQELAPELHEGWTYRAEYLQKPKHNALAYDRVPNKHLIIFDISVGPENFLSYAEKQEEAARIGLECVPLLFEGLVTSPEQFRELLSRDSVLGGQKIEGVVVKNYARFGLDKKPLFGKFVSEAFKEVHAGEWKANNPAGGDIIQLLIMQYRTPARWQKAVQHLRERGELEQSPRDIGKLILEAKLDIEAECSEEIASKLLAWALPKVLRGSIGGLPEWYKNELLKAQFEQTDTESGAESYTYEELGGEG